MTTPIQQTIAEAAEKHTYTMPDYYPLRDIREAFTAGANLIVGMLEAERAKLKLATDALERIAEIPSDCFEQVTAREALGEIGK